MNSSLFQAGHARQKRMNLRWGETTGTLSFYHCSCRRVRAPHQKKPVVAIIFLENAREFSEKLLPTLVLRFGETFLPFSTALVLFKVPIVPLKKREGVPEMGTKPLKALRG